MSTNAVADGDNSFLTPTSDPQATLYTCTGDFNPVERRYAERLGVVGHLVEVVPRSADSCVGVCPLGQAAI